MLLWLLFVVSAIFIYVKVIKPYKYFQDKNIPYEKPLLLFGSMFRITTRRTSLAEGIEEIYKQHKQHKFFGFFNFLSPIVILRDPEVIKQVAIKEFDSFLDHQGFISEEVEPLFGKNIFALKGQKWRNMRSTLSPAFTSSKMKAMFILISDCAERFSNYFLKNAEPGKPLVLEMKDTFTRFASDVVANCAFGIECDSLLDRNNEFYRRGIEATDFSGFRGLIFFGYNFSPFLMKLFKIKFLNDELSNFFRRIVIGTMDMREKHGVVRPDMIQLLMQAREGNLKYEESLKKEQETGFATVEESEVGKNEQFKFKELTDDDLTAQALVFFFAGFDATSTLFCYMAHELAVHPDIQQRLQEEVDDTLANCKDGKITYEALTKMKYLDMVVCETLRKWPPSPFTDRMCTKSFTLKSDDDDTQGYTINKGDVLWVPTYCLHRDPDNFPDPERFDPERFNDDNKNNIKPCTYIPFGLGPRNCIGSRFVLLEAKVVFVYLLSKFDIVVDKKTKVPLKLSRKAFNMLPESGFWLGLKPRNK